MYWYPLAQSLAAKLIDYKGKNEAPVFEGVSIYVGSKVNGKTFPCIEITWDMEELQQGNRGIVSLWIDMCLKNNSSAPAEAYEIMHNWQHGFMDALYDWQKSAQSELGIAMKLNVPKIISDGDVQRPVCQSRIILEIEWRTSSL